jgi:CO/xanthine dehydrogenase FAD-binding subunit
MLLPKFEYHEPSTLDEACRIMAELGKKAKLLAGGTDLLVKMKKRIASAENLVSLGEIRELHKKEHGNGQLVLSAGLTAAELGQAEEMSGEYNALIMAANSLGSPLIRNLATIGGNLVSARPAADLPPPLMAYGARVVLKKVSGERIVSLDDFFRGPGETVMQPDEILTTILIDKPPPYSGSGYIKLGVRKTLEISLVNVAACISIGSQDGTIKTARVVLGAVAPTPMRAASAEKVLLGEEPNESLFVEAGEAAARDSRPIDDFRGSAEYRRAMVAVLTRRALNMALIKAKEQ